MMPQGTMEICSATAPQLYSSQHICVADMNITHDVEEESRELSKTLETHYYMCLINNPYFWIARILVMSGRVNSPQNINPHGNHTLKSELFIASMSVLGLVGSLSFQPLEWQPLTHTVSNVSNSYFLQ